MRRTPFILTAAALVALAACSKSTPPNASADANGTAPAPAVPNSAAPADAAAPSAASNGLWGVTEAEDEASHRGIDFIAFNRTGRTITGLAIRPEEGPLDPGAEPTPWGASILSPDGLPDGQRGAARFQPDIEICRWQLRATFEGGQTRDYPAVNLCETIRVDLR